MLNDTFEKKYFDNIYDKSYDKRNPRYKFESYLNQIRKFKPKHSSLIDVGCAYGSFLKEAKNYYNVCGVDVSLHAVETAKLRLPEIKIWQSDLEEISKDLQYDIVTCFDVIEHIPNIDEALQHLKTLLSNNGIVVISVPVYDTIIGKLVGMLDKDPTHVHKNSRYWWIEKLKSQGFEIIFWKGIWRYYFKNIFYLHHINSFSRSFTPAIFIIAQKRK